MKSFTSSFFFASLLLLPFDAVICQSVIAPEVSPFDRYGRINWEAEKAKLDRFGIHLKNHPDMIGYVYIQEAQISCEGYAVGHAIDVTKYLIQTYRLPWNKVAWRDLGYGDGYEVSLWLFPAGRPPQHLPDYRPETNYTTLEDCESLIRRSRWFEKRRALRRAANKRLQRTRR